MTQFRTPLKTVRGLGSAREGVGHWWAQRLTAMALAPLSIWFLWFATSTGAGDYAVVRNSLAQPCHAIPMILFVWALFQHGQLGLQVVIEDYVHPRSLEVALQVLVRFVSFAAGLTAIIAILILIFGGRLT